MNINKVPFDVRPSLGNFFSSVTAPFRWSDDESGNPYTGMAADESGSRMQDFYDRNGGSMGSIFSSTAANFGWGGSKASSFGQQSQSTPFFRTMTPSFLWDDDDDDLRTTCCPNMSLKKRIFGCVCLLMVGQLLQATCWLFFGGIVLGHPSKFATMYTLGNLSMLGASLFFSSPKQQLKKITSKKRGTTFLTFVVTMVLTLVTVYSHAFTGRALLILILVVVQWMALMWYILSFIPYGQDLVGKVVRKLTGWLSPF